jgi:hypothetical protein
MPAFALVCAVPSSQFNIQDRMQQALLGKRRWVQLMQRRVKIENLKKYMSDHGDEHPRLGCGDKVSSR